MAKPEEGGQDETDSPAPPEGDKPKDGGKAEEEVREQVVEILSCQGRLSGLQKQVRIIYLYVCSCCDDLYPIYHAQLLIIINLCRDLVFGRECEYYLSIWLTFC